jgi:hypothetical protein
MKITEETELRLARLICGIAEEEKAVDMSRQRLAEHVDFEPYAAFQLLDAKLHGYISSEDIKNFLQYGHECL